MNGNLSDMDLEGFFVEKVGIPRGLWKRNESELRRIARDAVHKFTKWVYGYEKFEREYFDVEDNVLARLMGENQSVSFLAKLLLNSDVDGKATILRNLTEYAGERPDIREYPACGVISLLKQKDEIKRGDYDLIIRFDDPLSGQEEFVEAFTASMRDDLSDEKKTAIFFYMIGSLKRKNRNNFAMELTKEFFESQELPLSFRQWLAYKVIGNFLRMVGMLAHVKRMYQSVEIDQGASPAVPFPRLMEREGPELQKELKRWAEKVIETVDEAFESDGERKIAEYLGLRADDTPYYFEAEKRIVVRWLLGTLKAEEVKEFIEERLGRDYRRDDFPIIFGILDFLKEGDDHELARRVIDGLKDANRYEIRKSALEAGLELFEEPKYVEIAKEDPARRVREWAENIENDK